MPQQGYNDCNPPSVLNSLTVVCSIHYIHTYTSRVQSDELPYFPLVSTRILTFTPLQKHSNSAQDLHVVPRPSQRMRSAEHLKDNWSYALRLRDCLVTGNNVQVC